MISGPSVFSEFLNRIVQAGVLGFVSEVAFEFPTELRHALVTDSVGSGAGLPGIPLAILFENKKFILLDSNAKKTRFMQQAKIELGLKNVHIVHQRVERRAQRAVDKGNQP